MDKKDLKIAKEARFLARQQRAYFKACKKSKRSAKEEGYLSAGMVKVRGGLGGTYWE